jgi:hypothetical protein
MLLLQTTTVPDNVAYLVLGLAMLALFLGGWLASYIWRLRNLRRDAALLAQLEKEGGSAAPVDDPNRSAQTT